MSDELGRVRQMWHLLEPLHAVLYYAPEAFEEAAGLGHAVDERWPSYFAWRAAPLGAVGADRVTGTFYSFSPGMTGRYVPAGWSVAGPEAVLAARTRAVDRAYRGLFGDRVHGPEFAEAAGLARRAALAADVTGRPLAEANAALPWPDAPHLALWQAATVLREHRGTATSRRSSRPASTRSSRWSPSRPSAPPARRCSRAGGGAGRSGRRAGNDWRSVDCWRRTGRPRTPGGPCAHRWNGARTNRRRGPGRCSNPRSGSGSWSCWGRCGWRCSARGCCRPRRRWASGRSETAPRIGRSETAPGAYSGPL